MNRPFWVAKLMRWFGLEILLHPHEKAQMGLVPWGRQAPPGGGEMGAKAKGGIKMSYRVWRAATGKWEDRKELK